MIADDDVAALRASQCGAFLALIGTLPDGNARGCLLTSNPARNLILSETISVRPFL
jgi:hypothetical protein